MGAPHHLSAAHAGHNVLTKTLEFLVTGEVRWERSETVYTPVVNWVLVVYYLCLS